VGGCVQDLGGFDFDDYATVDDHIQALRRDRLAPEEDRNH
jgi:hypothetical protein